MRRPRILMSARDLGAGLSVAEIARKAMADGRLDVKFVAQSPMLERLRADGLAVTPCSAPAIDSPSDPAAAEVLAEAGAILDRWRPDALLVSLSGPGAGIDEALLARSEGGPTYAFQDYWGDVNASLGTAAETYFVIDEEAARLTRDRIDARVIVAGSPKHASYDRLDVPELRREGRAGLGAVEGRRIVTFFGQPLWSAAGYARNFEAFAAALSDGFDEALVVYRPHPKESDQDAAAAAARLSAGGLDCRIDGDSALEAALAASDLVASCFSTAGYDLMMLNRISPLPLAPLLYIMVNDEIRAWYADKSGLDTLPLADQDLATLCSDTAELPALLRRLDNSSLQEARWLDARERLPEPARASELVLTTILSDVQAIDGAGNCPTGALGL